ncbi:MAG: hypothetical protein AAB662_00620 [Patescibacteria group bacterium]
MIERKIPIITISEASIRIRQIGRNGADSRVLPCEMPDLVTEATRCRFLKPGVGCVHPDGLIFDPERKIIECPLQKGELQVVIKI